MGSGRIDHWGNSERIAAIFLDCGAKKNQELSAKYRRLASRKDSDGKRRAAADLSWAAEWSLRGQRETTEQLVIPLTYCAMNGLSNRDHIGSGPSPSRWVPLWVFALVLVATGGAVVVGNRHEQDPPHLNAVQSRAASPSSAQDALQQTVKRAADQISDLQRQLSAEQAEQKLLSEQIGALAARVDSLERAHTQTTGSMKKRGGPR
jgi:hypothetical protein